MSYHLTEIAKGVLGELSKIQEELDEVKDAEKQQNKIMIGCELSDLYGAIEAYASKFDLTMEDLKIMSEATKRAFKTGRRVSDEVKEEIDTTIYKEETTNCTVFYSDSFDGFFVLFKNNFDLNCNSTIINCSSKITIKTKESGYFAVDQYEEFSNETDYIVCGKKLQLIKIESPMIGPKNEKAIHSDYIRIKEALIELGEVEVSEFENFRLVESKLTDVKVLETKQCDNDSIVIKGNFVQNISDIILYFGIDGVQIRLEPDELWRGYDDEIYKIELAKTYEYSYAVIFRGEVENNSLSKETKNDYKEYKHIIANTRLHIKE